MSREHHETLPATARVRVPVRRVSGRADAGTAAGPAVPDPLAGRGAQSIPHCALLAGVADRQHSVHPEPGQLPEAGQEVDVHPGAGHRRAVRVHDVRRDRGHRCVPGPHAVAASLTRHQRVLLRPVPAGPRHRCLATLFRVRHSPVRRLRIRHVLRLDHVQVSVPSAAAADGRRPAHFSYKRCRVFLQDKGTILNVYYDLC